MEYYESYAATYSHARAKFQRIAAAGYNKVRSNLHADKKTPDGEPPAIGVASFGDANAPRRGLIISGSPEGFFGSAVQIGPMSKAGSRTFHATWAPCSCTGSARSNDNGVRIRRKAACDHRSGDREASVPIRWEPEQKQ